MIARLVLALVCLLALAAPARAHEVRPAYLEIRQTAPTAYRVTWKQPTVGDMAIHLVPHISNGWLETAPGSQEAGAGFLVRSWTITAPAKPLAGATVSVEGLEATVTDVLVRIALTGQPERVEILRPARPRLTIAAANTAAPRTAGFFRLGVEHILSGPDHLLFVFGLLLVVGDWRRLIKTVTAFTAAHSLTLGLATLGGINPPQDLINALIALSILFMGLEVLRARRGGTSLTLRHPWVAAFAFGLLHGLGFASGLSGLGLTQGALALALVLFNLGVEAGQLAFIAVVLAIRRGLDLTPIRWAPAVGAVPGYVVGGLGAFWMFQSLALVFASAP